jgi:hypothetical protein
MTAEVEVNPEVELNVAKAWPVIPSAARTRFFVSALATERKRPPNLHKARKFFSNCLPESVSTDSG